jgi:hypothetical protein
MREVAEEAADVYHCSERIKDEVLQYARVLCARGLPAEYISVAVTQYAKHRTENEALWWN